MKHKVNCKNCGKEEFVYDSRVKSYKTCSFKCSSEYRKSLTPKNCTCDECGTKFHLKESAVKRYNRTMGTFCSTKCCTKYKRDFYRGKKNPNYRGRNFDSDGYRIHHYPKVGRIKEHHYVAFNILGIDKIPKGYCIHHRDCDIYNNSPENLVLLSNSDHRWIHKQFGNAGLYGYMKGLVSLDVLCECSTDKEKSRRLLPLNILLQKDLGESERGTGNYGSSGM